MCILIVEDCQPTRDAVAQGLKEEGFAADTADDGIDGSWMIEKNVYDLIIRDGHNFLRDHPPRQTGLADFYITFHLDRKILRSIRRCPHAIE